MSGPGDDGAHFAGIFPMSWAAQYLRIPFVDRGHDWKGCDCWGLVALIYAEQRNIELPLYGNIPPGATLSKLREILSQAKGGAWQDVEAGQERAFDVVLMRGQFSDGERLHSRPIHIGCVFTPGRLIHIEDMPGVSIVDYRRHPLIKNRVVSFHRFCQC